jgi:tRNA(Arg) A34 adenosine deaminase TadA
MRIEDYLNEAANYAISRIDGRSFFLAAIGIRKDGARVKSRNCLSDFPVPAFHAETRILRKMDCGGTMFVARIKKSTKEWALARPCPSCFFQIKLKGIKKVYYTIAPGEWGTINVAKTDLPKIIRNGGKRLNQFDVGRWNRGSSAYV